MRATTTAASGIFVTLGFVFGLLMLALEPSGALPGLTTAVLWFFRWLVLLGAAGLLFGAVNLFWRHIRRVQGGAHGWLHSLALVVTMVIVIGAGLIDPAGVHGPFLEWVFAHLLVPGLATLFALLIFFLAVAAYRLLRITQPGGSWMLAGFLLVLFTQAPFAAEIWPPALSSLTDWLVDKPVMAAVRGALLGASVAVLIGGLHYMLGRRR